MNNRIIHFCRPFLSRRGFLFLYRKVNNQIVFSTPQRILPEQIRLDIRTFETAWKKNKNTKDFNQKLWECCTQNSDLVTYALDLIRCACGRNISNNVQNFVSDIIISFDKYLQNNGIIFNPTVDQKIDALASVVTLRSYQTLQLVCEVFKIHDYALECKGYIDDLIKRHKFLYVRIIELYFLFHKFSQN